MTVTRLRVLALVHRHLIPPETIAEGADITAEPWRTEYDVISTLRGLGHEVLPLGVRNLDTGRAQGTFQDVWIVPGRGEPGGADWYCLKYLSVLSSKSSCSW